MKNEEIRKRREKIVELLEKPSTKEEIKVNLTNNNFAVSDSTINIDINYLIENGQIRKAEPEEIKKFRKDVKYNSPETYTDQRKVYYIINKSEITKFTSDFINKIEDYYNTNKTVNFDEIEYFFDVIKEKQGINSLKISEEIRFKLLVKLLKIAGDQISIVNYDLKGTNWNDLGIILELSLNKIFYIAILNYVLIFIGEKITNRDINSNSNINSELKENFDINSDDFIGGKKILEKHIQQKANQIISNFKKIVNENINQNMKDLLKNTYSILYVDENNILSNVKIRDFFIHDELPQLIEEYNKAVFKEMNSNVIKYNTLNNAPKSHLKGFFKKRIKTSKKEELLTRIYEIHKKMIDKDVFLKLFPFIFNDLDIFKNYLQILSSLEYSKFCDILKDMFNDFELTSLYLDSNIFEFYGVSIGDLIKTFKYDFNVSLILYNPLYAIYDFFVEDDSLAIKLKGHAIKMIREQCISYLNEKFLLFQKQENYSMAKLIKIILKN